MLYARKIRSPNFLLLRDLEILRYVVATDFDGPKLAFYESICQIISGNDPYQGRQGDIM